LILKKTSNGLLAPTLSSFGEEREINGAVRECARWNAVHKKK
jgi:hypothetical protein